MYKYSILFKNVSLNFITNGFILVLSIISIPIYIKYLGYDEFGLYLLFNIFVGYANYANNGSLTALIRYLVSKEKNKPELISSGILINLILGIIVPFILIVFGYLFINSTKSFNPDLNEIYKLSLYISSFSIPLLYLGDVFWTYPVALQKFELSNIKDLIIGGLQIIGGIFVVFLGGNVITLQIYRFFIHIFYFLFFLILYKFYFKQNFGQIKLNIVKRLINFAKFKFVSDLSGQFIFQSDKLLFSLVNPISYLPFYAVPVSIIQRLSFLISNITPAIYPFLINLNLFKNIKKYYLELNKGINIINISIFMFIYFNAKEILEFFVGNDFAEQSFLIMRIITISYLIFNFVSIPTIMFESIGKPKIPSLFSVTTAIILLFFYFIFVPINKIFGVAISSVLSAFIMVPIFLIYTYIKFLLFNIIYPLTLSILINKILLLLSIHLFDKTFQFLNLLLNFVITLILYICILLITKIISKHEIINIIINFKSVFKLNMKS